MTLTNLNNLVSDGVTLEFEDRILKDGEWVTDRITYHHADFMDDVYPDASCGQYDRGIFVVVEDAEAGSPEYFISFTDGSVWQGTHQIERARCPEICVMAAVRDAREPYYPALDEDSYRVVTS
jgi:hypothetical protein